MLTFCTATLNPYLVLAPPQVDDSRKMDSREVFMPKVGKEIRDTSVGELVRRAVAARVASKREARGRSKREE